MIFEKEPAVPTHLYWCPSFPITEATWKRMAQNIREPVEKPRKRKYDPVEYHPPVESVHIVLQKGVSPEGILEQAKQHFGDLYVTVTSKEKRHSMRGPGRSELQAFKDSQRPQLAAQN